MGCSPSAAAASSASGSGPGKGARAGGSGGSNVGGEAAGGTGPLAPGGASSPSSVAVTNVGGGALFRSLPRADGERARDRESTLRTTERIMQQELELTARCGGSADPGDADFLGPAQFLVCSPPGHEVTVRARVLRLEGGAEEMAARDGAGPSAGAGAAAAARVELYVFGPEGFPLERAPGQPRERASGEGEVSARLTLPGISGLVVCVVCPGAVVGVSLRGENGPILTVTHPEPLV